MRLPLCGIQSELAAAGLLLDTKHLIHAKAGLVCAAPVTYVLTYLPRLDAETYILIYLPRLDVRPVFLSICPGLMLRR